MFLTRSKNDMFCLDRFLVSVFFRQVIKEDTILVVDADKGRVKASFGSGLFYMPHGLKVDQEDNIWVTDVGLHQVMKFTKGSKTPSLGNK